MTVISSLRLVRSFSLLLLTLLFASSAIGQIYSDTVNKEDLQISFHFDFIEQTSSIDYTSSDGKQLNLEKDFSSSVSGTTLKNYIINGTETFFEVSKSTDHLIIDAPSLLRERSNGEILMQYTQKQSVLLEQYNKSLLSFMEAFVQDRDAVTTLIADAYPGVATTRTLSSACSIAIQNNILANIGEEIACFPNPATAQCGIAIGASTTAFQTMLASCFEDEESNGDGDGDDGQGDDGGNTGGGSSGGEGGTGSSGGAQGVTVFPGFTSTGRPTICILDGDGRFSCTLIE